MNLTIENEKEDDGPWIAEVVELPGVFSYGATKKQATAKAQALALRVMAERLLYCFSERSEESIGPR